MKILATDLDRTLLPNGTWEGDSEAIELFNELTKRHHVFVVYVTGRNLDLTLEAIHDYGIRYPNILCSDVGTSIRRFEDGSWHLDLGWIKHVERMSPRWDADTIKQTIVQIDGLAEQESQHLNRFKQSYYVEHKKKDQILKEVEKLVKGKFDEVIIYSYDSQADRGLLDFLPASATKQTSLEYIADTLDSRKEDVVFCGDSGNDIFPLTAGFCGVLVRNADPQLIEGVDEALKRDSSLRVYFARGNFLGLNGYYASGVIEGGYHYGIFSEEYGIFSEEI
ncbi:MAG: HAD-IIB family hydrolase [Gammaproteobacteria bacterium]|nr:HAD-IIB family hydrolase [Gammaproteobacteria bacterium]